jgi:hypothetical protein
MATFENALHVNNVSSSVYNTSKVRAVDASIKARELSVLVQKLLSAGIYESIDDAVKQGVPAGTFVIIDDPKTPDFDFDVKVV